MKKSGINLHTGFRGRFKVEKFKKASDGGIGEKVSETEWADNLILNSGLDWIGNYAISSLAGSIYNNISHCHVGTGSTAPAETDTDLQNKVLGHNSASWGAVQVVSASPIHAFRRCTFQFNPDTGNHNLTEFGIGWGTISANNLFSRALFKDVEGNPITITKLDNEFLILTYEIQIYPPAEVGQKVGTIDYGALTLNVYWLCNSSSLGSTYNHQYPTGIRFQEISDVPPVDWVGRSINTYINFSGSLVGTLPNTLAYVAGNYYRDATFYLDYPSGNWPGGLLALVGTQSGGALTGMNGWALGFDPPIPKTNLHRITLTVRFSWGRYVEPV